MSETLNQPGGEAPALTLICGMAAAGKSTLARKLGAGPGCVVLHEDEWLAALFGDRMTTLADYRRYAERLHAVLDAHIVALLRAGLRVVLDFPANTPEQRARLRGLAEMAGVSHALHVLDVPAERCWERLQARAALGAHPFTVTRAQFDQLLQHVSFPGADEGFAPIRHRVSD